jgi:hypothetical protein
MMDACAMVARCHRHQWPQEYGGREGVVKWTPELVSMVAERLECPDDAEVEDTER